MRNSVRIAVILAATLIVGILPTAFAQTGASEQPSVSGPFNLITHDCANQQATHPEVGVVGKLKSCSFIYQLDPASDGDSSRDYAAIWFQASATTTRNGWCVVTAKSVISKPKETELEAVGPRGALTPSDPRRFVSKMRLNTPGATGRIKQGFKLYPDFFRGELLSGGRHRVSWKGSTDKTLMFAQGMTVSYSQANKPPKMKFGLVPGYRYSDEC